MSASSSPRIASDRVRTYLTLVPYLLERGQVSVEEAARDFGITVEEMRAMVQKLTVIGLPGEGGYWQQPHELFDINWDLLEHEGVIEITNDVGLRQVPRFTAREAAALLAGLQMVAAVPAVSTSGLVAGLLAKLARAAAHTPADVVVATPDIDEVRRVVSEAVNTGVAVSFRYRAPDAAETTRTVDPVQIIITSGQWYLQGWCHLRTAMRTFHLDRVSEPQLTMLKSSHARSGVGDLASVDEREAEVRVRLPRAMAPLLGDFVQTDDAECDGDSLVVRLRMADPRGVKRLAARFGGRLEVLEPALAREATREWAAAGLALYGGRDGNSTG